MPRRSGVPHRDVLPDPKFGSKVVAKLTNQVMQDGKKGTAQSIVYEAFDIIKEKLGVQQRFECGITHEYLLEMIDETNSQILRYIKK